MDEINKLESVTLDSSIKIGNMLSVDNPNDICSKQNIVINSTTTHIDTAKTGDIDDDYDMGL